MPVLATSAARKRATVAAKDQQCAAAYVALKGPSNVAAAPPLAEMMLRQILASPTPGTLTQLGEAVRGDEEKRAALDSLLFWLDQQAARCEALVLALWFAAGVDGISQGQAAPPTSKQILSVCKRAAAFAAGEKASRLNAGAKAKEHAAIGAAASESLANFEGALKGQLNPPALDLALAFEAASAARAPVPEHGTDTVDTVLVDDDFLAWFVDVKEWLPEIEEPEIEEQEAAPPPAVLEEPQIEKKEAEEQQTLTPRQAKRQRQRLKQRAASEADERELVALGWPGSGGVDLAEEHTLTPRTPPPKRSDTAKSSAAVAPPPAVARCLAVELEEPQPGSGGVEFVNLVTPGQKRSPPTPSSIECALAFKRTVVETERATPPPADAVEEAEGADETKGEDSDAVVADAVARCLAVELDADCFASSEQSAGADETKGEDADELQETKTAEALDDALRFDASSAIDDQVLMLIEQPESRERNEAIQSVVDDQEAVVVAKAADAADAAAADAAGAPAEDAAPLDDAAQVARALARGLPEPLRAAGWAKAKAVQRLAASHQSTGGADAGSGLVQSRGAGKKVAAMLWGALSSTRKAELRALERLVLLEIGAGDGVHGILVAVELQRLTGVPVLVVLVERGRNRALMCLTTAMNALSEGLLAAPGGVAVCELDAIHLLNYFGVHFVTSWCQEFGPAVIAAIAEAFGHTSSAVAAVFSRSSNAYPVDELTDALVFAQKVSPQVLGGNKARSMFAAYLPAPGSIYRWHEAVVELYRQREAVPEGDRAALEATAARLLRQALRRACVVERIEEMRYRKDCYLAAAPPPRAPAAALEQRRRAEQQRVAAVATRKAAAAAQRAAELAALSPAARQQRRVDAADARARSAEQRLAKAQRAARKAAQYCTTHTAALQAELAKLAALSPR